MPTAKHRSDALKKIGRAGPSPGEMELLRAATLDADQATAAWKRWLSSNGIDDAHRHATSLLPAACANLPAAALGPDADLLRGVRRRAWAETRFQLQSATAISGVLEPLGVTPLVVKGAALAQSVYPEPGVRVMSDIDLVVGDEHFHEAFELFERAGWSRPRTVESPFDHAMELTDPQGRAVDVHRWVLHPRFAKAPERSWIERSVECADGVLRRFRCSDELVLTALHGLMTNGPSCTRWPLDVVHLGRNAAGADGITTDAFWREVVASATEIGAGPVLADALEMCRVELAAAVPEAIISELAAGPVDTHLAQHWALTRRGVKLEWRVRRYVRLCRAQGRRPTIGGYVGPRLAAARSKGFGNTAAVRIARAREIVTNRRRT